MSAIKTKSPKSYFVRVNGEIVERFTKLKEARLFIKNKYRSIIPGTELPKTVEVIKQVTVEEVVDMFTPQPMQLLMATDLDKDFYK